MQKKFDASLSVVMDDIKGTITTKFNNYGHANILEYGAEGVLLRMADKFNRLRTMIGNKSECTEEPRLDTWRDIVGYGLIGMMLEQGLWPGQSDDEKLCSHNGKYKSLYIAGPIDMCTDFSYIHTISDMLADSDVDAFFPQLAYNWGSNDGAYIKKVNQIALQSSEAVLVYLPDGVHSIGTIYELHMAIEMGKPIAAYVGYENIPMYLRDERIKIFNNLECAVNYLLGR